MSDVEEGMYKQDDQGRWVIDVPFDSPDPEFIRGFTCGMIWQLIELDEPLFEISVRSDCLVMCTIMADSREYVLEMEESGEPVTGLKDTDWLHLCFTKKGYEHG